MTKRLGTEKLQELARDFEVGEDTVVKIFSWMDENAGDYDRVGELADAAIDEFPEVMEATDEDDDLFYELAFMFESVVG